MATNYYTDTSQDALTADELRLYQLIMDYRATMGLPAIPLSLGLTITASRHALDQMENLGGYRAHSWSDAKFDAADEATFNNMWLAPERIGTTYQAPNSINYWGYEISAGGSAMTPEGALGGWQRSAPHNAVMSNTGPWETIAWKAIGVAIYGGVAHVWFGAAIDPGGYPTGAPILASVSNPIDGTPEANHLDGTPGVDIIKGLASDDTLIGRAGDDALHGGQGRDFLYGGEGNDHYFVDDTFDVVDEGFAFPEFGAGGFDTIKSSANWFWDVYSVAEVVILEEGAAGSDGAGSTVVAGIYDSQIYGNSGNNILFGRGGNDVYAAGDGVDFMSLSTLGLDDENAYPRVNGFNTVVVERRESGPLSYDIVFEYEVGWDNIDLTDYDYGSFAEVMARGYDDGLGNSYFVLGDGLDYLYLVGVEKAELTAADFWL